MIRIPRTMATAFAGTLLVAAGCAPHLLHAQTADGSAVALTGARLIDGTGGAAIERSTLVIRNGRIERVGPASTVAVPEGAEIVDLSGKTILPGLVNAHGHLNADQSDRPRRDKLLGQLSLYANYGITTVVVLGSGTGDLEETVLLGSEQDSEDLNRARVYVAGPSLRDFDTAEEARMNVNLYADANADIVKIHITGGPDDMTPPIYGALIDEAHARGLRVAAHLYYLEDARGLVDAGVDILAHSVRDETIDAGLIAEIKRRNIGYTPTLTRDLAQFVYEDTPAFFEDPFFVRNIDAYSHEIALLNDPALQEETRNSEARQAAKPALEQANRNLKILSDAGVLIAMGTDSGTNAGQWQGYFEHTELEMMVEAGMSPAQVIVAATGGAARAVGLEQEIGTLQPGRWGDVLVLDANPLEDIRATREIDSVWVAGNRLNDQP